MPIAVLMFVSIAETAPARTIRPPPLSTLKRFGGATLPRRPQTHVLPQEPLKNAHIPYSVYYMGMDGEALGHCGYAVRNFEVVAHGDIGAPPNWVAAAKAEIITLEKDDGHICADWK